jgi:hypothetical protein
LDRAIVVGVALGLVERDRRAALRGAFAASLGNSNIDGDAVEPRAEFRFEGKAGEATERVEKGVLREVGGAVAVAAREAKCQSENMVLVAFDEDSEEIALAVDDARDERAVFETRDGIGGGAQI